jgi:hypothetical protein
MAGMPFSATFRRFENVLRTRRATYGGRDLVKTLRPKL